VAKFLIAKGANTTVKNNGEIKTALSIAILEGFKNMAQLLRESEVKD